MKYLSKSWVKFAIWAIGILPAYLLVKDVIKTSKRESHLVEWTKNDRGWAMTAAVFGSWFTVAAVFPMWISDKVAPLPE